MLLLETRRFTAYEVTQSLYAARCASSYFSLGSIQTRPGILAEAQPMAGECARLPRSISSIVIGSSTAAGRRLGPCCLLRRKRSPSVSSAHSPTAARDLIESGAPLIASTRRFLHYALHYNPPTGSVKLSR